MFSHYGVSEREGGREERKRGEREGGWREGEGEREREGERGRGRGRRDRKERDTFIYISMTECFMACF